MRWTWVVALLIALIPTKGLTATLQAPSCAQADVDQAIKAASDGDTVTVPPGSCTWISGVIFPTTKGLTLQGAGIDQTTITGSTILIRLHTGSGKSYRVTGFTLNSSWEPIRVRGTSTSWRIDNNKFTDGTIQVNGPTYGVIDHNVFTGPQRSLIWVMENSYDLRGEGFSADGGAASWTRPLSLGTADAVYVEDNTFDFAVPAVGVSAIDGRSGSRWVFRYNNVKNIQWGSHDAEIAHERGTRQFEAYNNTFTYTEAFQMSMFHRGGTGVVFGNRFKAVDFTWAGTPLIMRNSRSAGGEPGRDPWHVPCDATSGKFCRGGPPAACNTDADCTGDFVGPCVRIDGVGSAGWPCRDQIGCSTDDPVTGVQALEPLYLWDNYYCYGPGGGCNPEPAPKGSGQAVTLHISIGIQHILKNRDYFEGTPKPGYTPYIYPHPLTSGTTSQRPNPPTNLRIN